MKKIMFNDKYGLTEAVLQGCKTMTRRLVPIKEAKRLDSFFDSYDWYYAKQTCIDDSAAYMIGETIAVAQSYKDLGYTKEWVEQHISPNPNAKPTDPFEKKYPGWSNKMFVPAELNKAHQIQITDIKVERLQDISKEDCFKEGIYKDITAPECYQPFYTFVNSRTKDNTPIGFDEPQPAFAALIDKVSGNGTWEINPYVFAYTFKLLK